MKKLSNQFNRLNMYKTNDMKMKRGLKTVMVIVLLSIVCFFFSCEIKDHQEIGKIMIDPHAKNTEVNITVKSIVQLETSDSSLIGHINTVKYYKNRFYIFDQNISKTLFVFDSTGKFINKTRLGHGPGEIIEPWNFCIDEASNTILLWDQMPFNLNVYDLNLSFIKSINCPSIAIRSLSCLGDGSFLILSQMFPVSHGKIMEKVAYDYFVYSRDFQSVINKIHITDPRTSNVTMDNPICKSKQVFFIAPMDNNIYRLTKDYNPKPFYKFDLGKYQVTDNDLNKGTEYYRSEMKKGNKICSLGNLFLNDNYITVSYSYRDKTEFCIYNRKSRKVINSGDPTLIKQLPRCEIKGLLGDSTFIGVVEANDYNQFLKDGQNVSKDLLPIDNFSNQVIFMFISD